MGFPPDRFYMLDMNDHFFSLSGGVASFTKKSPDRQCEIRAEHLEGGQFKLKNCAGYYFKYHPKKGDHIYQDKKGKVPILFTAIELESGHAFSADKSGYLQPQINIKGRLGLGPYSDKIFIKIKDAALKRTTSDVVYSMESAKIEHLAPETLVQQSIRNDSREKDIPMKYDYKFYKSNIGTWDGGNPGKQNEVPVLREGRIIIEAIDPNKEPSEKVERSTQLNIPPGKKGIVKILIYRAQISVSYQCTEKVLYRDGWAPNITHKGTYVNKEYYGEVVEITDLIQI